MATSKVTLLAFCVALAVLCAYGNISSDTSKSTNFSLLFDHLALRNLPSAGAGAAEVVAQPLRHSHRKVGTFPPEPSFIFSIQTRMTFLLLPSSGVEDLVRRQAVGGCCGAAGQPGVRLLRERLRRHPGHRRLHQS